MGEQFVDVQYRGLEVGRRLKIHDFGPTTAYLQHPTPLPVGTRLEIHTDDGARVAVSVLRVQEQVAGVERQPGAFVAAGELDDEGQAWWAAQVSVEDAVIPEAIPEAAAEDEVAAEAPVADEVPVVDEAPAATGKRKRRSRAKAAVDEGGAETAKASDEAAAKASDEAAATASDVATETKASDDAAKKAKASDDAAKKAKASDAATDSQTNGVSTDDGQGKRKRRGRRKKK